MHTPPSLLPVPQTPRRAALQFRRGAHGSVTALFVAALLTAGCAQTPTAVIHRDPALTLAIGTGVRPARRTVLPSIVQASTATPLSLWLFAEKSDASSSGVLVELTVVDARGNRTDGAVVQPPRLQTDSSGVGAPITFLASRPGEYFVRVTWLDGTRTVEAYGPRLRASAPPAH